MTTDPPKIPVHVTLTVSPSVYVGSTRGGAVLGNIVLRFADLSDAQGVVNEITAAILAARKAAGG